MSSSSVAFQQFLMRFSSSSVSFPKSLIVFTMVSLRLTSSFRRSYCCVISPILTSSSAPVFSFLYREMKGMVQPSSSKEMVFSTAFLERFSSLEIRSMISVIRLFVGFGFWGYWLLLLGCWLKSISKIPTTHNRQPTTDNHIIIITS